MRVQLVEAVLQRRAGQDEGIGAAQPLHHVGGLGAPVLDPLRLVEDDQVEVPSGDFRQIAAHQLVVDDVEELRRPVELPALDLVALDDLSWTTR